MVNRFCYIFISNQSTIIKEQQENHPMIHKQHDKKIDIITKYNRFQAYSIALPALWKK